MRRFSVTRFSNEDDKGTLDSFMIEAADRSAAHDILTEELGVGWEDCGTVFWGDAKTTRWRSAWRHGRVKVLRATKVPKGIE